MMAKQAADVLMEARKDGKADQKKYQGLMKAVNKWIDRDPKECEGMDDLLAELKQRGVDQKAIQKCDAHHEKDEDKCVGTASKKLKIKKVQKDSDRRELSALKALVKEISD